tara:strand:- start:151 stop:1218 length:1068 start_codon:yes stop_codon:yes gene_type:complete
MKLSDLEFSIPEDYIALRPKKPRDMSNLVEVKNNFKIFKFRDLINLINPGDCLVFNNTKVIPCLLKGTSSGKKIEITLNKQISADPTIKWTALCKPLKKVKVNDQILFSKNFFCNVIKIVRENNQAFLILEFEVTKEDFLKHIKKNGSLALPPYITKKRNLLLTDKADYQPVFSKFEGAVASPTASLHFSENLIKKLEKKGVITVYITLHVNGATFLPIREKSVCNHKMHYEFGKISEDSARKMNDVRKKGNKLIAVGTTVVRLLESAKTKVGKIKSYEGDTNIFIKPGWVVNTIDGLITNFHTPRSTLLLLIYSLIGEKKTKDLYNFAIKQKLRFFSYGDACLIWLKNEKKEKV